jgi:hypothetical protein
MMKKESRLLLLLAILFGLYALDPWSGAISPLLRQSPWRLFLIATIDALVLHLALRQIRADRQTVAFRTGLLYFGLKTAVVAVEAIYLPEALPPSLVLPLSFNGLLTALIIGAIAGWLYGRAGDSAAGESFAPGSFPWLRWVAAGFAWMLLFIATGLLIFQPVATALDAPVAAAYLADFTPEQPLLILGFQIARGMLWALLAFPFLQLCPRAIIRRGALLGVIFAGLMGSAILHGIDALPPTIWPAHLAEVVVENFLFGFVVSWAGNPLALSDSTQPVQSKPFVLPR